MQLKRIGWHAAPMTPADAEAVVTWRYEPPYDFYNPSADDIDELLDGSYCACREDGGRVEAFFCTGRAAQVPGGDYQTAALDIGVGLRPEMTGHGWGRPFLADVLDLLARNSHDPGCLQDFQIVRLTVARFNARAIHLYRTLGFQETAEFTGTHAPFVMMDRPLFTTASDPAAHEGERGG